MIDPPPDVRRTGSRDRPRANPVARARAVAARTGLAEPLVLVLLAIAFLSAISGKPLDGLFMLVVAAGLAWDAGRRSRADDPPHSADEPPHAADVLSRATDLPPHAGDARSQAADDGIGAGQETAPGSPAADGLAGPQTAGRRSRLPGLAFLASTAAYAVTVGSFRRYSWPATAAVVGLGAIVVVLGWRGPLRFRQLPPRTARLGLALWGGLLVTGGIWELAALLAQPSIEESSAAHPTISTLTDPLLASAGGRTLALAIWLAIGCFLILR